MSGRFNKSWVKLLAASDRKLQTAELEDIQTIVSNKAKDNFKYLYSQYNIIRGLVPQVKEVGPDRSDDPIEFNSESGFTYSTNTIAVSAGQVFIVLGEESYFVDIEAFEFEAKVFRGEFIPSGVTTASVVFNLYPEDSDEYNDPLLPGISLTRGAQRLKISYEIVINEDGYPICYVQEQGPGVKPIIYSYRNNKLTLTPSNAAIPKALGTTLQTYFREEQGNFISSGMTLDFYQGERVVVIQPGESYIDGCYKLLNHPIYVSVPPVEVETVFTIEMGSSYIPRLTKSPDGNPLLQSAFLNLGLLVVSRVGIKEIWKLSPSTNRAYTNSSIVNLIEQNLENIRDLADVVLSNQTTNAAYTRAIKLDGTVVDAFNSLKGSDINSLEFSATIDIDNRRLQPSSFNSIFTFLNTTVIDTATTQQVTKNLYPYYIAPVVAEQILINQDRVTSFLLLETNTTLTQSMVLNPNVIVADPTTKEFKSEITSLPSQDIIALQSIITVTVTGLPPKADNLIPKLDSVLISNVTLLGNTKTGSTLGSLMSADDGTVEFQFTIPQGIKCCDKTVSLTSTTISTSSILKYKPYFKSDYVDKKYELSNPYLNQTFSVATPAVITRVGVRIKSLLPSITLASLNVLEVYICETQGTTPAKPLSKALITVGDINQTFDSTRWTYVDLQFPAILETPGTYSLVVCPLVRGVEMWVADSSLPDFNLETNGSTSSIFNGQLFKYNSGQWSELVNKDIAFSLIKAQATNSTSTLEVSLSNPLGNFTSLLSAIPNLTPGSTSIDILYKEPTSKEYKRLGDEQLFPYDLPSVDLKFVLNSSPYLFPIIDSSSSYLITRANQLSSTWVSRSFDMGSPYTNVEVDLSYFLPRGNEITVSISSNDGQSWTTLESPVNPTDSSLLVDGNIPLYRGKFRAYNISSTVPYSSTDQLTNIVRTNLRIRIVLTLNNLFTQPYIQDLTAITY